MEERSKTLGQRFTKDDRLLHRADFQRLRAESRKVQTELFIALFEGNGLKRSRLGVTASRRVGKAATRNRIKRLVREYFRQNRQLLSRHWDIHVIAKKSAADQCGSNVFLSLGKLFNKIEAR